MKRSEYFSLLDTTFRSGDNMSLAEAFVVSVKKELSLLSCKAYEVGCGYGIAAETMLDNVFSLTVTDIDSQTLEFISWKYGDKILIDRNGEIPSDSDFIYYFMSLHHMFDYKDSLIKSITHILHSGGKGVAICELIPQRERKFHINEHCAFDGLAPKAFDFVKDFENVITIYYQLPSIKHNNVEFECYSLIIKAISSKRND